MVAIPRLDRINEEYPCEHHYKGKALTAALLQFHICNLKVLWSHWILVHLQSSFKEWTISNTLSFQVTLFTILHIVISLWLGIFVFTSLEHLTKLSTCTISLTWYMTGILTRVSLPFSPWIVAIIFNGYNTHQLIHTQCLVFNIFATGNSRVRWSNACICTYGYCL